VEALAAMGIHRPSHADYVRLTSILTRIGWVARRIESAERGIFRCRGFERPVAQDLDDGELAEPAVGQSQTV
jgi:hypothetical protein